VPQSIILRPRCILNRRPSGVGAGSNPAVALILIVVLIGLRFGGEHLKETIMKKRLSVKARVAKRCNGRLASITTHIIETIWAIGTSGTAAVVISSLTHEPQM
jgi:hypothetical protein